MATLAKHLYISYNQTPASSTTHPHHAVHRQLIPSSAEPSMLSGRRSFISILLAAPASLAAMPAAAQSWGTKSFIKEKFFEPGLSPEESVARIRQTAEGLRAMREMLDRLAWTYVRFYIRLKSAYLSHDLNSALLTLPENRRNSYVTIANELIDNMAELDYYVRTPKIYESYIYYEKTLKSIDDLVAMLA